MAKRKKQKPANEVEGPKGIDDAFAAGVRPDNIAGEQVFEEIQEIVASACEANDVEPEREPTAEDRDDILDRVRTTAERGGEGTILESDELLADLGRLRRSPHPKDRLTWHLVSALIKSFKNPKVSIRAIEKAIDCVVPPDPTGEPQLPLGPSYCEEGGRLYLRQQSDKGEEQLRSLADFTARITTNEIRDDGGGDPKTYYVIEGQLPGGKELPRVTIPATEYEAMKWTYGKWPSVAAIHPGGFTSQLLRYAIQALSGDRPTRTVYTHTGWKEIDGRWVYLHAGGAIGAEPGEASVLLTGALGRFRLPDPPDGQRRKDAVRASLSIIHPDHRLAPDCITVPLLAGVYRAPLGWVDLSILFEGESGVFKSEAVALAQQHFGPEMVRGKFPSTWLDTANAILMTAFALKDAVHVVDDYAPKSTQNAQHQLDDKVEQVVRGVGNGAGRNRLTSESELRPEKFPRSLIMSTGENVPPGCSLRARSVLVRVGVDDIDRQRLSKCQTDAASGLYAEAMAAYIAWLAPRYGPLSVGLSALVARLRDELQVKVGGHQRAPANAANLLIGWRWFLDFAEDVAAITADERVRLEARAEAALIETSTLQAVGIVEQDQALRFMRILRDGVAMGRAHLTNENNDPPIDAERYGWRFETRGAGDTAMQVPIAKGTHIGWVIDRVVYLSPEGSYQFARQDSKRQGQDITLTQISLRQRLKEKGLLFPDETRAKENRLTVRKMVAGTRHEVLYVHWMDQEEEIGTDTGPVVWSSEPDCTTKTRADSCEKHANGTNGTDGTVLEDRGGSTNGHARAPHSEMFPFGANAYEEGM